MMVAEKVVEATEAEGAAVVEMAEGETVVVEMAEAGWWCGMVVVEKEENGGGGDGGGGDGGGGDGGGGDSGGGDGGGGDGGGGDGGGDEEPTRWSRVQASARRT